MAAGLEFCSRAEMKCRIFSPSCWQHLVRHTALGNAGCSAHDWSCGWPSLWYLSAARGSEGSAGMWLTVRGFMGREESYKAAEAVVVALSNALNRAQ